MGRIETFAIAIVLSYPVFMFSYLKTSEFATRPHPQDAVMAAEIPSNN